MDKKKNMYIAASYQLYDVSNGKNELLEETTENRPFDFISGMGIALEAFENALNDLKEGDKFDFILTPAEAYGDYNEEHVTDLDKAIFTRDGKDRKSTRLNSSHANISYAVFCLKKKKS